MDNELNKKKEYVSKRIDLFNEKMNDNTILDYGEIVLNFLKNLKKIIIEYSHKISFYIDENNEYLFLIKIYQFIVKISNFFGEAIEIKDKLTKIIKKIDDSIIKGKDSE